MKKKLSLQKNKQLASNFLRGPFTDTTVVDQNGEKSTQQSHSTQNGHTYGFNFFLKDKFASAAAHTYASACVGHGPRICVSLRRPRPMHMCPPRPTHMRPPRPGF